MISNELYEAIVDAQQAVYKAHNLCYADKGAHGASRWMAMQLGKAQSILMHYEVKYAGKTK